jgi:hypothetical protein
MTHKVGKYTYETKQHYIDTLATVFVIFFVSGYFISFFRQYLHDLIYFGSIAISMIMMLHLTLKYALLRGKIKSYRFDNY